MGIARTPMLSSSVLTSFISNINNNCSFSKCSNSDRLSTARCNNSNIHQNSRFSLTQMSHRRPFFGHLNRNNYQIFLDIHPLYSFLNPHSIPHHCNNNDNDKIVALTTAISSSVDNNTPTCVLLAFYSCVIIKKELSCPSIFLSTLMILSFSFCARELKSKEKGVRCIRSKGHIVAIKAESQRPLRMYKLKSGRP